ncbi:acyl-CoA dehydrogenase family protein [Rhizobacter sp. LjRoot28]|uniref:acyl-CoA dehydrogenase family protein n=1 Tax=Rhizobacter sp. LjRoot28 TaxID=3342309 RepID=UPI003ECD5271
MDFNFSEEQLQLQDAITRFVQGDYSFEQRRAVLGTAEGWSRDAWKGLADLGVLAMLVPEDQGGLGYGPIETQLALQATGPALLAEPLLTSGVIATALVRDFATEPARAELLGQLAAGERIVVVAHQEAAARGEVGFVETRVTAEGDGFVLNGAKAVVYHAAAADELIVSARASGASTDPAGVSLFRVPKDAAGLELRSYATIDGQRAAEVTLNQVKLPASARLGAEGAGLAAVERALDLGLAAVTAEAVGIMEATVNATGEYLKTRQQFGQPIGRFQALQHRMADMLLHLEQARSMSYLAAMDCQNADDDVRRKTLSAAKVTIGQACRYIAQQAVQLHGGMGMTDELVVSHWFKRLLAIELSFGDTDLHLQRFAELSQRAALKAAA